MTRFAAGLGAALALVWTASGAQEAPLEQIRTSYNMYQIGLAQNEPLYLLAAAQLRKSIPMSAGTLVPEGGKVEDGLPVIDADTILAAAAPLITGDPALEGLAEDILAMRNKGVKTGPVYSIVTIKGGGQDRYPGLPFSGGKYAEIYVEGAKGTDLNLLVHDGKNRLVCSDTDISTVAYCGWHPKADDTYSVTVINKASKGGRYSLMSN